MEQSKKVLDLYRRKRENREKWVLGKISTEEFITTSRLLEKEENKLYEKYNNTNK